MTTPVIERLAAEVAQKFPTVRIAGTGIVCRKIANSSRWSQHAWGNAADLHVESKEQGDALYRWLVANKTRLSLATICWRDHGGCNAADHQTHVHVSGAPKKRGTPPCAGGSAAGGSQIDDPSLIEQIGAAAVPPWLGGGIISDPGGGFTNPVGKITDVASFVAALGEPETWLRVLWFVGGAIAVVGGVTIFVKETTGVTVPAGSMAAKAIKAVTS